MRVTDRTNGGKGEHLFGALIRRARERAGLSQVAFGQRCGVTQAAVSAWEGGKHPLLETTIETAARALGVSVVTLLLRELSDYRRALAAEARARRKARGKGEAHA